MDNTTRLAILKKKEKDLLQQIAEIGALARGANGEVDPSYLQKHRAVLDELEVVRQQIRELLGATAKAA